MSKLTEKILSIDPSASQSELRKAVEELQQMAQEQTAKPPEDTQTLTPLDWQTLEELNGVEKVHYQEQIANLERLGFVQYSMTGTRRSSVLRLTNKGRAALDWKYEQE